MAFCSNCGQQIPQEAKACPACGTQVAQPAPQQAQAQQQVPPQPEQQAQQQIPPQPAPQQPNQQARRTDYTADFDPKDAADNKLMAILAYLGWLVLIPLLVSPAKDSPYVRFHVNQGLILFICGIVAGLLSAICIGVILGVICLVLTIIGIINAANGQAKELPIIGKFRILK